MSNYKLAIADYLLVPMAFTLVNGETETEFKFKLQTKRLKQDEWRARFSSDAAPAPDQIKEAMFDITTGWRDQTLVLDESGAPATFCREALDEMFAAAPGLMDMYVSAYLKEVPAKVKN
jgi:hypothetical protein